MAKVHTPVGDAPVIPLVLLGLGVWLAWFGVHYFKSDAKWPTDPIKSVLAGSGGITTVSYQQEQQRSDALNAYVATFGAGAGSAVGAGAAGAGAAGGIAALAAGGQAAIAADAQQYVGQGYQWGGNAATPGQWDCSSFVSYVLGHDLGLALPGGHWGDAGMPPHSHGPTTASYALYGTTLNAGQVQAGDLIVWSSHMGIATDNAHVVSARDPQEGVGVDTIAGTTASLRESPGYRRVPLA